MMTISNDGPASYEQVEALQEAMQEQMRAMQLKIEEYESKLDEIKSYVEPKESEEMTWEKFKHRLHDMAAGGKKQYIKTFNKL